jgi:hypothetical protein
MMMSPGARSDGAVDKEIESENESVSPVSASQSSELVSTLIKLSVFVFDTAANYASVCPRQFFSEPVFLVVCDPSMNKL